MTIEELEKEKKNNQDLYKKATNNVAQMEQTLEIQNYLQELENIKYYENYEKFLNGLEIGEDGTIFAPRRNYNYTTFDLSEFIRYAFTLKYYGKENEENQVPSMQVSFKNLREYRLSAIKTLREMKKYPDEREVENLYGLEVYPNPKENFECAETTLLLNCIMAPNIYSLQEELEQRGERKIEVDDKQKIITISDDIETGSLSFSNFIPVDITSLSMREQNAFFGEEAQRIFGVEIDDKRLKKPQEEGTIKKAPMTK